MANHPAALHLLGVDAIGIGIASATYEVTAVPPLLLERPRGR